MKMIEALIRPHQLEDVLCALSQVGIETIAVTAVRGNGREGAQVGQFRGTEYWTKLVPMLKIEMAVAEPALDSTKAAILRAASGGDAGNGMLVVYGLDAVSLMGTGEKVESMV